MNDQAWETVGRNSFYVLTRCNCSTKMMWPPDLQQHPGASLRFFFLARRKESPNDVTTSYATASRCVNTVPFSWRDGQNHQIMWPPAMQQHPGASLRFHFMARRTESPNNVTTRYATASRCITTVPYRGETGRITTCRYKILRPVSHPPIVHSFIGTARTSGAVPPALNASLRFLFRGETDRITKWCDHQLCNSIQVRQYGSFFLARRTESPNDVTTSYATASRCVTTEVLHLFRCSTHTHIG